MKKSIFTSLLLLSLLALCPAKTSAQYYEIANQLPNLIQPALSGSLSYKGFVDASFLKGVGSNQADFLDFSTVQGFTYSNWFFMGAGIGVDVLFAHTNDNWGSWDSPSSSFDPSHSSTTTGVMIPVFSDFRFNIANDYAKPSTSFFIDVRLGASFLVGKDYIRINNGYLTSNECFYLRPSIGVRIPVNKANPRQAVNIGIDYQLITSDYWSSWSNDVTLSSFGVNVSYEW